VRGIHAFRRFDIRCIDETVRRNERFRALRNSSMRAQEREQIYRDLQLLFLRPTPSYIVNEVDLTTQIYSEIICTSFFQALEYEES
jgi:hypothetical protein